MAAPAVVEAEAGARGERAPVSAWYALAVLVAVSLFAFVDRQIINLVAPALQRDIGLSDVQLGIMHGLGLALCASVAAYPIGWASDRFGRRLVLGCCVLFWSMATAACAFQTSFTGIFITTAGVAIGEAALAPVIFSMMPDLFPERQRNTANFIFFGVALLGVSLGLGLGGAMLGLLEASHAALPSFLAGMQSWRVALILAALPGPLFVLLLASIRMRSERDRIARLAPQSEAATDRVIPFLKQHGKLFVCIYLGIFAYNMPLGATFAWLPIAMPRMFPGFVISSLGVPLGITVGIGSIVGLVLAPLGLKLFGGDAHLKPLRIARFYLVCAGIPALLMLFAQAPWHLYACVGAQLTFLLAAGALMPGILQQLAPPMLRSRLISVLGICTAIAGGLGPMMVGMLSGLFDTPRGLVIATVIVAFPAWLIAATLISAAMKPFVATAAAIRSTSNDATP